MPPQAPNPSASALSAAELGLGSFLGNDSIFGREEEGGQASFSWGGGLTSCSSLSPCPLLWSIQDKSCAD